jgi:hypothetical protein
MPPLLSSGSTAREADIFAGELSAIAVEVKGITSIIRKAMVALRAKARHANRITQATIRTPAGSLIEVAEANEEAAEAEIERIEKLFPGCHVERHTLASEAEKLKIEMNQVRGKVNQLARQIRRGAEDSELDATGIFDDNLPAKKHRLPQVNKSLASPMESREFIEAAVRAQRAGRIDQFVERHGSYAGWCDFSRRCKAAAGR